MSNEMTFEEISMRNLQLNYKMYLIYFGKYVEYIKYMKV